MVSSWKYLFGKERKIGGNNMILNDILSQVVGVSGKKFGFNGSFPTIRYITKKEYEKDVYRYVEPEFSCISSNPIGNCKFILFSAPGATGKTALSKHICYTLNGIYWNLPDIKVAEHSFEGGIVNAVSHLHFSDFIKSLNNGEIFLVIDGFDEAEAGSGRSGIEFFLRDLDSTTKECTNTCAILMARTESAIFIKNYLKNNGIAFCHYEIGKFQEDNAVTYIKNQLEKFNIPVTNVVNNCISEQFKEIGRIISEENAKDFIGYAPVLDALAKAYDNSRNTLTLLRETESGKNNCILLKNIIERLMNREQKEKFMKSLSVKLSGLDVSSLDVYNRDEQLCRLGGFLCIEDTTVFSDISNEVPVAFHEEYLDVANTQIPQHPFLLQINDNDTVSYDFSSVVFRDYMIAYSFAHEELFDFTEEYLSNNTYCPSQMLIEFYNYFSGSTITGRLIPIIYNSFNAKAKSGDILSMYINGDKEDCSVEFVLERNENVASTYIFKLLDLDKGIYVTQLENCYIDIEGDVYIGDSHGEARINNTVINCNEIVWNSSHVLIEAYCPGECVISAARMSYSTVTVPRFDTRVDAEKKDNLKVCVESLKGYFKLMAFKQENIFENDADDFIAFSNLLRRILSCLRSHSKDALARKRDFVDNRIIGASGTKMKILKFLMNNRILYIDNKDWLYKLDTNEPAIFGIKWNDVKQGDYSTITDLYNRYMTESVSSTVS